MLGDNIINEIVEKAGQGEQVTVRRYAGLRIEVTHRAYINNPVWECHIVGTVRIGHTGTDLAKTIREASIKYDNNYRRYLQQRDIRSGYKHD